MYEMSKMPSGGITRRSGATTGSVSTYSQWLTDRMPELPTGNQESTARNTSTSR